MRLSIVRLALVGPACVIALSGCAGKDVLDLGGDAGRGIDAAFVVGSTVPCGDGVCSSPDVCCVQAGDPTIPGCSSLACEADNRCPYVAIACTVSTCPMGSVCCSSLDFGETSCGTTTISGLTRCVEGSACPDGMQTACALAPFGSAGPGLGCAPDELCTNTDVGYGTCEPPDGG